MTDQEYPDISHWNHRVIRRTFEIGDEIEHQFGVYEVYYDTDGKPIMCTETPVAPAGETIEELRTELERYTKALENPILNYEDF